MKALFHHVMNRGRHRQNIFQGNSDYESFFNTLADRLALRVLS